MKQIEAINTILRLNGHTAVNEVADGDQRANRALETLTRVRRNILLKELGFNQETVDFVVSDVLINGLADRRVAISKSYLRCRFPDRKHSVKLETDDSKLYVWNHDTDDWESQIVNNVEVTYDVEDYMAIPEGIAQWIAYEAASEFFIEEHNGMESTHLLRRAARRRTEALNALPPRSIDHATGWAARKAYVYGGR